MLDNSLKQQLEGIFADLQEKYLFEIFVSPQHESRNELLELLGDVAECSPNILLIENEGDALEFFILKNDMRTGISFRSVPNGHEFNSLLLAILNLDGKGKNLPDEFIQKRIKNLNGKIAITTYMSLSCTNCPDIVQALNIMTIYNPNITHEAVDGAINQQEINALKIQGVPAVFVGGEMIHSGRSSLGELLEKLEAKFGLQVIKNEQITHNFDIVIVGGGPAGSSAAIYSARKGLKVAVVAERIGGQVNETVAIENLISIPKTTGATLTADLKRHILEYPVQIFENRLVEKLETGNGLNKIFTTGREIFECKQVIIATGANWRRLNVEGEAEYIGHGVHFCPHCDGPFYAGKNVTVVGGGNSGIEAAVDLAGIVKKVTVIEFLDILKADIVLQNKIKSLPNVEIFLSSQVMKVIGNEEKVTSLKIKNSNTGEERIVETDGVFVQIGLSANSNAFSGLITTNNACEIEVDNKNHTNIKGIYAAGDVTSSPYKQIIIAMGDGAKAALSAFDDRIREEI